MQGKPLSLKRALTRWLVQHRIGKKPSTRKYYKEVIKQIRRAWSVTLPRPVDQITADEVTAFAIRTAHYSATRFNAMVSVLQATVPAASHLRRRPVTIPDKQPPSQMQFAELLRECDRSRRSHAALIVNFLAHTGMRIGEARKLEWSCVFPDRIEVPGSITKSGRPRTIPIINGLADVLDRLRGIANGSPRVLPSGEIKTALRSACKRVGLRPLSHHDFRRMFATRCVESGVDIPTVAGWLGHRDRGVTLSRYIYVLDGHSRTMAARVRI